MKKISTKCYKLLSRVFHLCIYAFWSLCNVFYTSDMRSASLKKSFGKVYQNNIWRSQESASGSGSTNKATKKIINEIERILDKYKIDSVLDIPCGDFNWMQNVNFGTTNYIGADIVDALIYSNKERYPNYDFRILDIVHDRLPQVNMIIVRDLFVHLPYTMIAQAITNIKLSNIEYLLTTTFPEHKNYDIAPKRGAWRPVNLEQPPIQIEAQVLELFAEGCDEADGEFSDKSLILFRFI